MKLIKFSQPRTPEGSAWKGTFTCNGLPDQEVMGNGCGAQVELKIDDVFLNKEMIFGEQGIGMAVSWGWLCPCCGLTNELNHENLPRNNQFLDKNTWLQRKRDSLLFQIYTLSGRDGVKRAADEADIEDEKIARLAYMN